MIETSLQTIEARFAELEAKSMDPAAHADAKTAALLMKEYRSLMPLMDKIRELRTAQTEAEEAALLASTEKDAELVAMANAEVRALRAKCDALSKELQIMLVAKDPNDDKSIIVEIRAGAGGEEAALDRKSTRLNSSHAT